MSGFSSNPSVDLYDMYYDGFNFLGRIIDIKPDRWTVGFWPFKETVAVVLNQPIDKWISEMEFRYRDFESCFVTGYSAEEGKFIAAVKFMYKSIIRMKSMLNPVDLWRGCCKEYVGFEAEILQNEAKRIREIVKNLTA